MTTENKTAMTPDLSVNFAGVTLRNPIVTLSGTCGTGIEYEDYYKVNEIGAISVKGMTLEARNGNPPPRLAETPAGMLNSIGLQNPGAEYFIKNSLPRLLKDDAIVMANIAGSTEEDYVKIAELMSNSGVHYLEMNISCPNVKHGGAAFGTDPVLIERLTRSVKEVSAVPVIVKLSPNVTDITEMARAAVAGGADALSLINTLLGMRINIRTRRPMLHNNVGGLSGPAIFPVALRMVWQVRKAVGKNVPILGMGGVATANDAIEMLMAGADTIGVGTAMFQNPRAPIDIVEGIADFMRENNIAKVSDLVGTVEPW